MYWWPFSRIKPLLEDTSVLILYQSDTPLDRARKIFLASGLRLNLESLSMLSNAANVIEAYHKMDTESQKEADADG
jgi:hypothetical protein